jgi:hypothetical protein
MPDDIFEREVLGEAHRACDALVDRVRGRVTRKGGATAGELSQYAAAAFQTYAETLLRALMAAAMRRQGDDAEAWVKRQFHAGLDSAGTPLREAVAESPHRHAVAQGLQQKMFEAEIMLRRALKARFADAPVAGFTPAESGVSSTLLRRKAAG